MPAGLGGFDAQGIWQFGEADTEVLMSDLLNKGMQSVTDQLVFDRARLTDLEADAGWIQITTFLNGWAVSAAVKYRVLGGVVYWRGAIQGGSTGAMFDIPVGARPDPSDPAALSWLVNLSGTATGGGRVEIYNGTQMGGRSGQHPVITAISYPADA